MSKNDTGSKWRSIRLSSEGIPEGKCKNDNQIITSRYTWFTFLPKGILEQFRKKSNFFFLFMVVIQLTVAVPTDPSLYVLTFNLILLVSICKSGYEDWLRHRADDLVNSSPVHIFNRNSNTVKKSKSICVGQVIRLEENEDVPADLLLLSAVSRTGTFIPKCEITTANLDGEPNLKLRLCTLRFPTTQLHDSAQILDVLWENELVVEYDEPNADLYKFNGRLFWGQSAANQSPLTLTIDNVLLRGTTLRNAQFVYGLVLYAGSDTRLSLNTNVRKLGKFSIVDTAINRMIYAMAAVLAALSVTALIECIRWHRSPSEVEGWYLPQYLFPVTEFILGFQLTLLCLVLFGSVIPISLSVSVEIQKFMSRLFFSWDEALHCPETGTPPLSNNSDVVEELGQIDYLLTDKTGTLTENNLKFVCCSIGGAKYDYSVNQSRHFLNPPPESRDTNENYPSTTEVNEFFEALALCHTVQAVTKHGDLSYQGMSSDEEILVTAANDLGISFRGEDSNGSLILHQNGIITKFTRHFTFQFDCDRKCMSVIVEDGFGRFFIITKGAETSLLPKCLTNSAPHVLQRSHDHANEFAKKGLRTLMVAKREISKSEFTKMESAISELCHDPAELISFYTDAESQLVLLGVTGVEDKLQEGVPATLTALKKAGIHIWMLTGDKMETAINIGLTSNLIHCNCTQSCVNSITDLSNPTSCIVNLTDIANHEILITKLQVIQKKLESRKFGSELDQKSSLTLVLDSISFNTGFINCRQLLADVAMSSSQIVFCRMTPLQKAQVVRLARGKARSPFRVCAVGDGGNDVAMIQEAHVAIGIMGKEGRQAARAADFALPKFYQLQRAILVHGSWNYERLATLVNYFFYRAFLLCLPQFDYAFKCGFSGMAVFDTTFMMFYALIFSSFPVLIYGISERRYSAQELLKSPELYKNWKGNALFSWNWILYYTGIMLWHTFLAIYLPRILWSGDIELIDWAVNSHLTNALVMLVTDLKLVMRTVTFTWLVLIGQLFSFGSMIIFYCISSEIPGFTSGGLLKFAYFPLLSTPGFWYLCLLVTTLAILPDLILAAMRGIGYRKRCMRLSQMLL